MPRRVSLRASIGLGALASVTIVILVVQGQPLSSLSSRGPLQAAPEHGMVIREPAETIFIDRLEILRLEGRDPAVLLHVESVGGDGAFRYLGAMIAGPDRKLAAVTYLEGFPPDDGSLGEIRPAIGAQIRPVTETTGGKGYELLIGYEVEDDTKVALRTGIVVTYRVGAREYVWRSPARLLYCSASMPTDRCEAVAEGERRLEAE